MEAANTAFREGEAQSPGFEVPPFLRSSGAFVRHYVVRRRREFLLLALTVAGAALCAVVVQYMMKLLVDAMAAGPEAGAGRVWHYLALFIGVIAAESILWRLSGWLACRATVGAGVDMRIDLFDHLSGQEMRYFTRNLSGSLGQRITSTAGNFGALANTVIWRIAPPTIDFLGAVFVFAIIDWRMSVALAAIVLTVVPALIVYGEWGRRYHQSYAAHASEAAGELTDVISNMWSVKAFTARAVERARLAARFDNEAHVQRASWMYLEKTRLLYDLALWLMAGGMLTWALHRWTVSAITTGDVVVISALTFRILHGTRDLALSLVEMVQQFGFIDDTLHVIGKRPAIEDRALARTLIKGAGRVEFKNVSFAYDQLGGDVIAGLNLIIPAGQKVGIVGPSGAGKSTLISLIQRLYDVREGEILIDDQPLTAVSQNSLREVLAVVPQEISLFHRSIIDNIRFGRRTASDEEVFEAARAAKCDHFVRTLPLGYQTIVGERGTMLSGGQRQRVGIARAFLKAAPILIMDEATSALDTESEIEIQRTMLDRMKSRTVIAVAHRLSTVMQCDRVLVMSGGEIVEDGHPHELLSRKGIFSRMWHLQAEGGAGLPWEDLQPA